MVFVKKTNNVKIVQYVLKLVCRCREIKGEVVKTVVWVVALKAYLLLCFCQSQTSRVAVGLSTVVWSDVWGGGFGSVSNGVTRLYIHVVSFTDLTNMCEGLISVNTNTCEKCFGARAPVPVLHDGVSWWATRLLCFVSVGHVFTFASGLSASL